MSRPAEHCGRQRVLARLLIPAVALLLLPPLSCFVFHVSATRYAYSEAERELSTLQQQIEPLLESGFSEEGADASNSNGDGAAEALGDSTQAFLKGAGVTASQLGGNARLLILSNTMKVVYPRNEQLREDVAPLAADFARYFQENGAIEGDSIELSASDGETYLAASYDPPSGAHNLAHVVVYCPTSHIGEWVDASSLLVLGVSSVFALVVLVALVATARSITRPLARLCRSAERIGAGDFVEIAPTFGLGELEELRCSMNDMSRRLEQSEQSQKRFLENVSHELRSPLMSIGGYAQGIERGVFDPPQHAARVIMDESARLAEVVDGLLCLSRLEGNVDCAALCPTDVVGSLNLCVDRARGLASSRGISIEVREPGCKAVALATDDLFDKVMDNLLSNAIRYAQSKAIVSICERGDRVEVTVADDGPGIGKADLPHVFERCYKGEGGHFGLGLSIAQSAARRMGASLSAENGSSQGATFTLSLRRA